MPDVILVAVWLWEGTTLTAWLDHVSVVAFWQSRCAWQCDAAAVLLPLLSTCGKALHLTQALLHSLSGMPLARMVDTCSGVRMLCFSEVLQAVGQHLPSQAAQIYGKFDGSRGHSICLHTCPAETLSRDMT